MSSVEENNELVQPYYIIDLNERVVLDYAPTISEAERKYIIEQHKISHKIIIVKPVKWKTITRDITETGK